MITSLRCLRGLLAAPLLLLTYAGQAQNGSLAVNTDGSPADGSALLDVKSTTQGMLVPRMNAQQRATISQPATGLLVYQTDGTAGFYFYNGTAWTSLSASGTPGPKGDKGDTGATGASGPQGPAGASGPKGDKGDTGATGPQGPSGATAAKGDKGDTGAQGPKGDKGETGAAGSAGSQGIPGPVGASGAKGDKGDTGAAGQAGFKGDKGETGAAGVKGDTGTAGAKGDKGDTGAQGPKGETGSVGPQGTAGIQGPKGDKGDTGATGQGVPAGGTAGQVLTKVNATDYNTQWMTPGSSSGTGAKLELVARKLSASQLLPVSTASADVLSYDNVTTSPTIGSYNSGTNAYTVGPNGAGLYLIQTRNAMVPVASNANNTLGAYNWVEVNGAALGTNTNLYPTYVSNGSLASTTPAALKSATMYTFVAVLNAGDVLKIRATGLNSSTQQTLNNDGGTQIMIIKL